MTERAVTLAVRILIAAIALVAIAVAVLAFLPGSETRYLDERVGGLLLAAALWFFVEFHLDLFSRTRTLWPARVVRAGIVAMQALLLVVLPVTIARSREPAVPAARVVER